MKSYRDYRKVYMKSLWLYMKTNIDILLLISGTAPLTYQYLTGLHIPMLVYVCSIASAIALEFVLVQQVKQDNTNIWGTLAIVISSVFLILIAVASYLPSGLYEAQVLTSQQYYVILAISEAVIHSVFALLILCTAMSKRYNIQQSGITRHIEQYKEVASKGFVCDVCGKVCKTAASLKQHKTRKHKKGD